MNEFLHFAIATAQKAGKLILKAAQKKLKISKKGKHDLVTQADKAAENLIIQKIKKAYPEHKILAEEESFGKMKKQKAKSIINIDKNHNQYLWLIDPIDGTTNYAHGLKQFAISIALLKNNNLVVGVVFAPAYNELFYAEKGKGAFLNNKKIKISKIDKLKDALVSTGFPYKNRKKNLPHFAKMLYSAQAVRRLGSASLDLCYVACGRLDGYWEFKLKPWDIAAGTLILKEAGGKISDLKGDALNLFGQEILASNGKIHKEMIERFQ